MSAPVTQQPLVTLGMSVVGNRNVKNLPKDENGLRNWSNGLFSCCNDPGTCVTASVCPCITYGQNTQRFEHLTKKNTPDPKHGGVFNGDALNYGIYSICCGLGWIITIPLRDDIRTRYSIRGSTLTDCCAVFWCHPCALTQEAQEIALEEGSF